MTHKTTTFGGFDRRAFLRSGAALGALSVTGLPAFAQAGHEITIADIGVGDPGGDWSRFSDATGHSVNMVSIGNAPAAIINQLLAGGGMQTFDIINIVGGMQKPLAEADLIQKIDRSKLPNLETNT